MDAEVTNAVEDALPDGIDFDGLVVHRRSDGDVLVSAAGSETAVPEADIPAALGEYAEYATNWHFWHARAPQADDRWAFLRWLERADDRPVPDRYDALAGGHTREWGQLAITVTVDPGDGARSYDLRHVEDVGADVDALDTYRDPLDVRDLVKYDDRGRYRPLKTAPTLPTGWVFSDLSAADLVRAVDFAYPATVANWHRERAGDLDVSHWRETVDRQTGIYGVVKTWDRGEGHDHVNRVAETCCEDSQCLKRREWEYDENTDLDVDGGEGTFPCREPCSLVIAAAREWTKLEGERSRTYEFELTPSEKEQVEAIVAAVADGRAEEIREADFSDPANRYRARYLRAKRFEDGDLSGVPTDPDADDPDADADDDDPDAGS
jgi:hypothetical protein